MQFATQVQESGDEVRVTIRGELDLTTAPDLERTLGEVEASPATTITLDLDQVEFLDSTGLRTLLEADSRSRANGSRLRLTRGSPPVRRLFHLVGADARLPFTNPG